MLKNIPRRQVLKTAALGAFAGTGAALFGSTSIAKGVPDTASGSKLPRLFSGCCAFSYSQEFKSGRMTMEQFIQKAVQLRVDAVDVTGYYLNGADPSYLYSLRQLAFRNAILFSGVACGMNMVQTDKAKRADSLMEIKNWIDITDRLGAPHLRVFAGKVPSETGMQQAIDWVVETMKAATEYSAQRGIVLGMEDSQGVSQSADVCLEIMHRVDSPYAGINLDITHFVATPTQDAYSQIAACIPFATQTHIRSQFDDHTPIDLDRIWKLFAQAGFRGFMSAEYESKFPDDPTAVAEVAKLVAEIRDLCKKYSSTSDA
jgi:sugar phosphate isomerase/epimerase